MTEAIDHREYNKFSNKSKNLIKKVQQLTVNATQLIPQLYDSLREDGIPPLEARTYIEEIIVISQRQLRRILPDEAKHIEKLRTYDRKSNKPDIPPPPKVVREAEIIEPKEEFVVDKVDEYIANVPREPEPINEPIPISISIPDNPLPPTKTIEVVFDPAPIDRDRTQVFIMQIDPIAKKVIKYKTVGRRTIR